LGDVLKKTLTSTIISLYLISCASLKTITNEQVDIEIFAAMVENTFATSKSNTENIIKDQRVRIRSDALNGIWFYTQLNTGADGKLYRQRLSQLTLSSDGMTIIQKTYGLKAPEIYVDAWENPERLSNLTTDEFESYFQAGCEQVWRADNRGAWTGYVDPKTCVVSSKRRNKDIRIESESYLSKDLYRTNERGYELDMTFLWGTKPGEMIDLYPVH